MRRLLRGLVLAFAVCNAIAQSPPATPCPQVMRYETYQSQWIGVIQAPNPPPYGSQMKLSIKMSIAAQLPSQYVGKVDLADDRSIVLQKINRGYPIAYRVHFPLTYPIPNIVQIVFDNRLICSGPPAVGQIVTSISLEHVLNSGNSAIQNTPKEQLVYSKVQDNHPVQSLNRIPESSDFEVIPVNNQNNYITTPTTTTTYAPPETTTIKRITVGYEKPPSYNVNYNKPYDTYNSIVESSEVCGVPGSGVVQLIYGGEDTSKGDWPWLTAICRNRKLTFVCAGSLISNRVVLTAAHCTFNKDMSPVKPTDLIIRLGVQDLEDFADPTAQSINILEIKTHPNYRQGTPLANDIALFKLSLMVTFNQYIRPVCLWAGDASQEFVYGKQGTVIGWGQDETDTVVTLGPRKLKVPIVSTTDCKLSRIDFYTMTGNKTLCAGARDGTGPCKGDSGGGLYVKQNSKWAVRGIVSFALPGTNSDCNHKEYTVYTDVALYTDWIQQA